MSFKEITKIELPAVFPFATNAGLHGDMLFFETGEHQMTISEGLVVADSISFEYRCYDSDEGTVTITYRAICGSPADADDVEGWDVEVHTGSDVWGLAETASAIAEAIALHKALGRDLQQPRG